MKKLRYFDRAGKLTRSGQRHWAFRNIRRQMRDLAREVRRAGSYDYSNTSIALNCGAVHGAISLARATELISESEAARVVLRLMKFQKATVTRRPFRLVETVRAA